MTYEYGSTPGCKKFGKQAIARANKIAKPARLKTVLKGYPHNHGQPGLASNGYESGAPLLVTDWKDNEDLT
jgi:hypothetical protein